MDKMITKKDILQTLHSLYNVIDKLNYDINNCIDIIDCKQITDLIDSSDEISEILRYMICEIE